MKKKIVILGSTGSIGKSLIKILKKNKKNFDIELLSANKNYKELLKQAKLFNVKNIIISDKKTYSYLKRKKKIKNINIFRNFTCFKKILRSKKVDYTMSAITGISGLAPTIDIIKYTKTIAIANKESIICGWNLINTELNKNEVKFIPVDSEHFSIWYDLRERLKTSIDKIFITASGGPFLNFSKNKLKKVKINDALKHPNWKMGKKISIDSATMMNKIFEIIEAKKIFNLPYSKIKVLIHPNSYVHSVINFNDGMTKIICHDTTMEIPIQNSLYYPDNTKYYSQNNTTSEVNNFILKKMNNLNFSFLKKEKFPSVEVLNLLPSENSLFETVIVSANDELVNLFLNKLISFNDISKNLLKIIKKKEFTKFKKIKPSKINQILKLHEFVRLKTRSLCI